MKVIPKIDEFLLEREDDIRRENCFHPSELSNCPRDIYDSFVNKKAKQEKKPVVERIFDNGKDVHTRIQKYLKDCGILIRSEVEFYDEEFNICGSADGLIEVNGSLGVIEIKSINLNQFLTLFAPKKAHIEQINLYMFCLMLCYPLPDKYLSSVSPKNLEWGIILYECKDNQQMKEFFVSYNSEIVDALLAKIKYVNSCILNNQIPPRIEHENCRWCKKSGCV